MATVTEPNTIDRTDRLLTREDAAAFLGVKPNTLIVWSTTKRQKIPFYKIGRNIRYKLSDLVAYLESCKVG